MNYLKKNANCRVIEFVNCLLTYTHTPQVETLQDRPGKLRLGTGLSGAIHTGITPLKNITALPQQLSIDNTNMITVNYCSIVKKTNQFGLQ